MAAQKKSPGIFYLHTPDEVRHPYEAALANNAQAIEWFTDFDLLVQAAERNPSILIIDLDILKKPLDLPLEQLRTFFPKSDLVALSSQDSAQMALRCLHSGFSDFLLKPLSPEELAWSIRKSQQKMAMVRRVEDPGSKLVRTISQISSCTTPSLVRICTLEFLEHFFEAKGAAWVSWLDKKPKVLCSVPRKIPQEKILKLLSADSKASSRNKLVFPCHQESEGVLVWGMKARPNQKSRRVGMELIEHSEMSLLNIQKLEELKQQTFVDDLTGLYNSRYLKFAIHNAVLRSRNKSNSFAVFFIDVDHFKRVNDTHGHVVGSEFLVAIGKTIRNAVRNIDPVFRYGGDEFVVIVQDTGSEGAWEIAERIRKNIERRVFVIKGERLQATVSIGLASFPEHASDPEVLLKQADEAMYEAKQRSRNAVHLALDPAATPMKKAANSRGR